MAYVGSFAITAIQDDPVTEAGTFFVGRSAVTGGGSATITGTYTGDTPVSMKGNCGGGIDVAFISFEADGGDWNGILPAIAAGTSLSLTAINGAADESAPLVMANFGCGDYGVVAGQSNAKGSVATNFNGTTDPLPASHIEGSVMFYFDVDTGLFALEVPGRDYHMARAFSLLSRHSSVPFCIVNVAIGGTAIATWKYPSGTSWVSAASNLAAANVIDSGNEPYVLWWQGENDKNTHADVYKAALLQLVLDMRREWGINELLAVPLPYTQAADIAAAIIECAVGGTTGLFPACCAVDIRYDAPDYGDDIHVKRVQEAAIIGDRIGQTLLWRAGYTSPAIGIIDDPIGIVRYAAYPTV